MPIRADDIETLHDFAVGMMARAGQQAQQVRAIALAILGAIIWRAEPGSLEIRFRQGNLYNLLCWDSVSGKKYLCAYNQDRGEIELHAAGIQGSPLHTLTNTTPIEEVERIFSTL